MNKKAYASYEVEIRSGMGRNDYYYKIEEVEDQTVELSYIEKNRDIPHRKLSFMIVGYAEMRKFAEQLAIIADLMEKEEEKFGAL